MTVIAQLLVFVCLFLFLLCVVLLVIFRRIEIFDERVHRWMTLTNLGDVVNDKNLELDPYMFIDDLHDIIKDGDGMSPDKLLVDIKDMISNYQTAVRKKYEADSPKRWR